MKVTTYEFWVPKWEGSEFGQRIQYTRQKASQAKAAFWSMLQDFGCRVSFTEIKVRSLRKVVDCSEIRQMADYRNVPFVHNGMRCEVCGKIGRIIGAGGGGCYLQVQFDNGQILYFHPQGDRCRFFDEQGNEIRQQEAA